MSTEIVYIPYLSRNIFSVMQVMSRVFNMMSEGKNLLLKKIPPA